jgi:hypothetical protein
MSLNHELHMYIKSLAAGDLIRQCIDCRRFEYNGKWVLYKGMLSKENFKAISGMYCPECVENWMIRKSTGL